MLLYNEAINSKYSPPVNLLWGWLQVPSFFYKSLDLELAI